MRRKQVKAIIGMVCAGIVLCLYTYATKPKSEDKTIIKYKDICVNNEAVLVEKEKKPAVSVVEGYSLTVGNPYTYELLTTETEINLTIEQAQENQINTEASQEEPVTEVEETTTVITEKDTIRDTTSHTEQIDTTSTGAVNRWNISLTDDEIDLAARILWNEARGECEKGQIAVVEVIFNRMKSEKFPNTLYDVLSQKGQFASWKNRGIAKNYEKQVEIVKKVLAGEIKVLDTDRLFFATSPLGTDPIVIGNHYFTTNYSR